MGINENATQQTGRLGRFWRSPYFPTGIFILAILVAHCILPTNTADDAWFAQVLAGDKATVSNWWDFWFFVIMNGHPVSALRRF